LATGLAFGSHRTGHESILDLEGSPRLLRKIKQSPATRNRVRFLRDSNSMLAIIGMLKITLHVKPVARRNIFLFRAVGHGILLRRQAAVGKLRGSSLGGNFHSRLFLEPAGLEGDAVRNRVDRMRFLILAQLFRSLLAPGAFAGGLR